MRAIITKYLPPTNHRNARIRVTDPGYRMFSEMRSTRSIIVPWDDGLDVSDNHAQAAYIALQKWDWSGIWVGGGFVTGDVFVCIKNTEERAVFNGGLPPDVKIHVNKTK